MSRSSVTAALVALLFVAALPDAVVAQGARRYIDPRTVADTAAGPFSGGVLVGNTFYLAGKIGLTADRKVPASAAEEARLGSQRCEGHAREGGHVHGRSRVGAGLLLGRVALRRLQPSVPHLLQEGVPRPGVPRIRDSSLRRQIRGAGNRRQEVKALSTSELHLALNNVLERTTHELATLEHSALSSRIGESIVVHRARRTHRDCPGCAATDSESAQGRSDSAIRLSGNADWNCRIR